MTELLVKSIALLVPIGLLALAWSSLRRSVRVEAWQQGVLYRDGRFVELMEPGRRTFFDPRARVRLVAVPVFVMAGSVGPIDVVSKDGFAYRITLGYRFRIADPRRAVEESGGIDFVTTGGVPIAGFADSLTARAMARAPALSLSEAQADPQALAAGLAGAANADFPAVVIEDVTVTRMTLPPEVRRLLSDVEAARLQGLAALERARSEGAALRSLANAARLVRDNPELGQLRLLQAIETARRAPTIVIGQPPLVAASNEKVDPA